MTDRGVTTAFVFGLVLLAVAAAFYIPFVVEDPTVDRQLSVNQSEGEEINVYNNLNATLTDVHDTQANATVELEDTDSDKTNSTTVADGAEDTLTLSDSQVTVNVTAINTTDTAEITYTYPPTFSWPGPMKTVADNLALIVMGLVAFIMFGFIWSQ